MSQSAISAQNQQLLTVLQSNPVIPVFNHPDPDVAIKVMQLCQQAGIRVFEFTNRDESAPGVFEKLAEVHKAMDDLWLGTGTVMDAEQTQEFIDKGAQFIVSPIMDTEMGEVCNRHNIPWVPGCGSLTEVITAQRAGSALQKVFPGSVLGPGFIKSVRGPCPQLNLMPTGGVKDTDENLKAWFDAGAHAVGMGSAMFPKSMIKNRQWDSLKNHIQRIIAMAKKHRES